MQRLNPHPDCSQCHHSLFNTHQSHFVLWSSSTLLSYEIAIVSMSYPLIVMSTKPRFARIWHSSRFACIPMQFANKFLSITNKWTFLWPILIHYILLRGCCLCFYDVIWCNPVFLIESNHYVQCSLPQTVIHKNLNGWPNICSYIFNVAAPTNLFDGLISFHTSHGMNT